MKISSLLASNLELTNAIRIYAEERFESLSKFSKNREENNELKVELEKTTNHHAKGPIFRAEAQGNVNGKTFRAETTDEDLYAAIDNLKDQLKRQLQSQKEKRVDQLKRSVRPDKS